jgi:DNA-binding MltR family transcriptional regulator
VSKSKSLQHLIKKPFRAKHVYKFINDRPLKKGTDFRAYVITSTALLEVGLERLIKARMRHLNSDEESAIFGPIGALSGFSSKIRIAYAFGIIGPETRRDLATINDIRNVFAHSPHNISFRDEYLFARLKTIKVIEVFTVSPGFLSGAKGDELSSRESGFQEAVVNYMMMLSTYRHKRVMLPPTRSGWGRQYCSLRF